MNGHSRAEAIAFYLRDIAERFPDLDGSPIDTPVFIFAAGSGSGEIELGRRLPRTLGGPPILDDILVATMGYQLVQIAGPFDTPYAGGGSKVANDMRRLRAVTRAQALLMRAACSAPNAEHEGGRWGACWTGLSGSYAPYLKLLFPRGRFVFLHRNPLDAYRASLGAIEDVNALRARDLSWAEAFAERWCQLLASFQLWCEDADGIIVSYGDVVAEAPNELEAYLGEPLLTCEPNGGATFRRTPSSEPPPEEIELLIERTRDIAWHYGYDFARQPQAAPECTEENAAPSFARGGAHQQGGRVDCAVLVPAIRYIEPECDEALAELERRGYTIIRLRGCPSIDQGRNSLATVAFEQGFEETLWIDADTGFDPDVVERLRSHRLPIVAGLCARKHPRGRSRGGANAGNARSPFGR